MQKKAILQSFDVGTYTATVQVYGSLATFLTAVPVNRAIPAVEMVAGRTVLLTFFDESNPSDAMVTGVIA